MTTQLDLFATEQAKALGLAQVAGNNGWFLEEARARARRHALEHGSVTADDVRPGMEADGLFPEHPNAWGAVFRCGFRWTGERRVSAVVQGHGNLQRVWVVAG